MGTIANAKVTHYYNCYNGDFIGCLHRELTGQKKSLRTQKKKLTVRIIWLNCQLFDYKPEKPFSFDPATIYNYNLLY